MTHDSRMIRTMRGAKGAGGTQDGHDGGGGRSGDAGGEDRAADPDAGDPEQGGHRAIVPRRRRHPRQFDGGANAVHPGNGRFRELLGEHLGESRGLLVDRRTPPTYAPYDVGAGSDNHRTAVVAAGTARGQRLRRLTAAVAGAVGIALVVVGGAVLGPWGDVPRHSSATSAPDPTSRADLVATFNGLLPKGRISRADWAQRTARTRRRSSTTTARAQRPSASASPGSSRSRPGSLMPRPS